MEEYKNIFYSQSLGELEKKEWDPWIATAIEQQQEPNSFSY